MPPLVLLLLLASGVGTAATYALYTLGMLERSAGDRRRLWRQAARTAGLTVVEETRTALTGSAGGLQVHFSRYEDPLSSGTRLTLSGAGLPSELTIRPLSVSVRGYGDIETGDPIFDSVAWVKGPPGLARAVLDVDTRHRLGALLEGRLELPGRSTFWGSGRLDDGSLRVDIPEVTPTAPEEKGTWLDSETQARAWSAGEDAVAGRDRLPEAVERVLALARRLAPPPEIPRRLAELLKDEPEGAVRRNLLATLTREFADCDLARDALQAARVDPDPQVRLLAGISLGPEGREVLIHLADGEGADDATTEKAVIGLGDSLAPEEALSILRGALRTRRLATARACLPVLGIRGRAAGASMLGKVLAIEVPDLAVAAAAALADADPAQAERPLLNALDHRATAVRIAAARALERGGTVAAIERLKRAEREDPAVQAPARQAIAAIQSRLPGAAPGQLSLAGAEAGRVSLAADVAGRVSLARKED